MISLESIFVILIIAVLVIIISEEKNTKKIFKVYSVRGRWYYLKYCLLALALFLKRSMIYLFGKSYFHKVEEMEKMQKLSEHKEAFDAVFFQAVTQNGIYFSAGTEKRHNNKLAGLVYIVHPDYGLLECEHMPHTIINEDVKTDNTTIYSGGGISFTQIIPMKVWKVSYKGVMKIQNNPTKLVEVKFEADWTSNYDWFLLEVDIPIKLLAKAIATEPWTMELFQNVGNQCHYEQMGYINGSIQIDGKTTTLVDAGSFRDHSFGFKRDWSLMHRFIYSMFFLSDRTKMVLGVVCQPGIASHVEVGYVNHPNGRLDPIEYTDLTLYQHGENGILPDKLDFTCRAGDISYEVKMEFKYTAQHYKGSNEEAIINERFGDCEVNGIPGKTISDWHYNKNNFE